MYAAIQNKHAACQKQGLHTASSSLRTKTRGKDCFDSMIWRDPSSTAVFYKFIASLRKTIHDDVRNASTTHRFIRTIRDQKRLVRCYTQNIDGLEEREGLSVDLTRGKGNRARFTKKMMDRPRSSPSTILGQRAAGGCEVVQLHGDLVQLRCTLCQQTCKWNTTLHDQHLLNGRAPRCDSCDTTSMLRQVQGKRGTRVGSLRPNVVLYGEEHPSADVVGDITTHDLSLSPDMLIILGTSLHVHGLKTLVREFARSVHNRPKTRGKVVFVNLTKPAESMWKDTIDYWVGMDCDSWVEKMRKCRPDMWQVQGQLTLPVKKTVHTTPSKSREANKENEVPDSEDHTTSISPSVKVVISPTKHQRKPLGGPKNFDIIHSTPTKIRNVVIADSDPSSSLPTPPASGGGRTGRLCGNKRKLDEDNLNLTPSKRRQMVKVWED